ncbi:EAL domain-containing protein [Pseudoalteromonas rubra]|uniref:EAL domain-containing protein n=1 Tax=Pseudoalteromonas rubra TaxID=43658 RepID=UPI0010289597|nr:EAL domain-containing protein [Pseudoalteromonas rubra]
MSSLSRFFLLEEETQSPSDVPNWRVSALRIILVTGLLLCLGIFINSLPAALAFELDYVLALTSGFTLTIGVLLTLSRSAYQLCAHLLMIAIVAAGVAIKLFIPLLPLAQLGSIFVYITPILALLLLSKRTAIFYAALNIIPFLLIVQQVNLSVIPHGERMLVDGDIYIHFLLFFFFNCTVPLAVWRTSLAASRLNLHMASNNELLASQKQIYQRFFQKSFHAIVLVDQQFNIVEANEKARILLGIQTQPLPCNFARVTQDDLSRLLNNGDQHEADLKTFHVGERTIELASREYHSEQLCAWYLNDVSDQHQLQQDLLALDVAHQQAKYFDARTNLPNKTWLTEQLQVHIDRGQPFALLIAENLNKHVLDYLIDGELHKHLYGHINQVAEHDPSLLDQIAYIGAGRLAIIIEPDAPVLEVAQRWHQHLDFWLKLGQHQFHARYAVGIATYPEHGYIPERLLKNAQQACELRGPGDDLAIFDHGTRRQTLARHEMALLLEKALEHDELQIVLQSKHDNTHSVIGYEALARWHSPLLGWVSPGEFVPIAEEFGLVNQLTQRILHKVCHTLQCHPDIHVPIAINVSSRDIACEQFARNTLSIVHSYGLSPRMFEFELTEYSFADDHNQIMEALDKMGFSLSIDDFGIGYSNIARVLASPIKRLKLDRSLVTQITSDQKQQALLLGILTMCDNLGIAALAEGVETQAQLNKLQELGVKEFQGYWFSRPVAVEQVLAHAYDTQAT